ncbi:MAG: hypothetical protein ICV79_08525, partial [Flavisolibacter sp.]|nr:hypothetical protein [Flavisolibacter sp.]
MIKPVFIPVFIFCLFTSFKQEYKISTIDPTEPYTPAYQQPIYTELPLGAIKP